MTDRLCRVELTASFLERLDAVEEFLAGADAHSAYDDLLAELRATVFPALRQFPRMGRRYLAQVELTVYLLSIRHHRQLSFIFARP